MQLRLLSGMSPEKLLEFTSTVFYFYYFLCNAMLNFNFVESRKPNVGGGKRARSRSFQWCHNNALSIVADQRARGRQAAWSRGAANRSRVVPRDNRTPESGPWQQDRRFATFGVGALLSLRVSFNCAKLSHDRQKKVPFWAVVPNLPYPCPIGSPLKSWLLPMWWCISFVI